MNGKPGYPKIHKFDLTGVPPGGDQSIILTEEDERILDKIWAEIRRRPSHFFGRTLPPLPPTEADALAAHDATLQPAAAEDPAPERNGALAGAARRAKRGAPAEATEGSET